MSLARSALPELILCDVHLPELDGWGVLAQLKREPALCAIPVLAVTALAMPGDREHLLAAGFDGYISKPIEHPKTSSGSWSGIWRPGADAPRRPFPAGRGLRGVMLMAEKTATA